MSLPSKIVFFAALVSSCTVLSYGQTAAPTPEPFRCVANVDCSKHGTCNVTTGSCDCNAGFIEDNCSYKQKSQLTAFLLNFFLGMPAGAGALYLGHYGLGAAQAFVTWSGLLCFFCSSRCDSDNCDISGGKFMGVFASFISVLAWGIFGGFLVNNSIDDVNNKPLKSW